MKKLSMLFALVSMAAWADTWTGTISDAKCGAAHADASEKSMKCSQACVKGGQAAVFVTDGKVLKIENQGEVKEHVGHKVELTGDLKGDTITVSNVKMVAAQ